MGLSERYRRIVLATGFHTPALADLSRFFESEDFRILWPKQDLAVTCHEADGRWLYEDYGENIELLRLNEEMLDANGIRWDRAEVKELGYRLSVEPFLKMFPLDKSVALIDPRLCLTLSAFSGQVTDLVFVEHDDRQATAEAMTELWGYDPEHWLRQQDVYEESFRKQAPGALTLREIECRSRVTLQYKLATMLA